MGKDKGLKLPHPFNQSINQSISQSIDNQSMANQSISLSIIQSVNQLGESQAVLTTNLDSVLHY